MVVLLILMIFSDGDSGTLGMGFKNYDDCSKGMAVMTEKIKQNNTTAEVKVTEVAMACVETRKAPKGAES